MARLQKKQSAKVKKEKKAKIDSTDSSQEATIASKALVSGTKGSASGKSKNIIVKSSTSNQPKKKNIFTQAIEFLQEVQSELKKVTWPTQKQTLGTTLVVIVLVAIVSVFLGLFDYGFSKLIQIVLA